MIKMLLLLFSATTMLFAGGWGTLEYAWITSFSIENYIPIGKVGMSRSHEHAAKFVDKLHTRAQAAGVGVRITPSSHEFQGSTVTESYMTGTISDDSEFVIFSGLGGIDASGNYDGGKLTAGPICYDGGTVAPADKGYGNDYTKWVFYDMPWGMRIGLTDMLPAFDGIHAMFGYNSSSVHGGASNGYSEEVWDAFSYNWITLGKTFWNSFKDAVNNEIYQDLSAGIEPKMIYLKGTADGLTFNGADETFTNVYNDRAIGTAKQYISRLSVVYGTPNY
ncbi:MAG: hypothetical protein OCD01_12550 [Fibrobacterales bacterium]